MRSRRDLARAARLVAAGLAMTMGVGVLATQAVAAVTGGGSSTSSDPVTLTDDDGAMAMFTATNVGGGEVMSRCLQVTDDSTGPNDLRMYAALTDSGLAPYLHLLVAAGSGGVYGDCSGFSGSTLYTGTLGGFAAAHTDFASGLAVPAALSTAPISFRFTVTVGDEAAAQGKSAVADFWWEAQTLDVGPSPTASPSVTPSVTASPSASPDVTSSPSPEATASPTRSATPSASPGNDGHNDKPGDGSGSTNQDGSGGAGGPDSPPSSPAAPGGSAAPAAQLPATTPADAGARIRTRVVAPHHPVTKRDGRSGNLSLVPAPDATATGSGDGSHKNRAGHFPLWVDNAAKLAAIAGKHTGFPLLMLLLAALFLVVQDRIDRREPKLALAPVHAEPDLPFDVPEEQS